MDAAPPDPERLSLGTKLAYGAPVFASAALGLPIAIHMTKFYADQVLVPLGALGVAIALARAFDAITDPLMGWISDRTHTRWGRRRPYLVIGAPLCGLAFVALFTPPPGLDARAGFVWFAVAFLLFYLFHTVYLIPHLALGAELSLDYHERSSLFSYREAFMLGGTVSVAVAPGLLMGWLGSERATFAALAIVVAVLMTGLYGTLFVVARERPEFAQRPANPLVPGVRRALRNPPFRILLLSQVLAGIPGALTATLLPFFTDYVLQPENPSGWLSLFLGGYFCSGLLCMPLWLRAARRFGKRPAMLAALGVAAVGAAGLYPAGPGDMIWSLACLCFSGTAYGALTFLSLAMKADVIDYDELRTGKRREAQYTSFWTIVAKFVQLPSAAVPIALLGSIGYLPNVPQTPEVLLVIRLLVTVSPILALGAAFVAVWSYPISPAVHAAIREGIAAHERGEVALDPISGEPVAPPAADAKAEALGWFLDHFSMGELRRARRRGPGRLARDAGTAAALALAVSLAATVSIAGTLSPDAEPGVAVVVGVLAVGVGVASFLFHVVRWRAARRFLRIGIAEDALDAHLRSLESGA